MSRILMRIALLVAIPGSSLADEAGLLARWELTKDGANASNSRLNAVNRGVVFDEGGPPGAQTSAKFDGERAWLEVPASSTLRLGARDFSVALWVETAADLDDDPGDLLSLYDPQRRNGFQLVLRTNAGTPSSQANLRQLQFGIDAGTEPMWDDLGRPGNAVLAFSLAVHDGNLYAGTCGNGPSDVGHVYRYEAPGRWADLGVLDRSNAVSALAVHDGRLYASTAKYRFAGSALTESPNLNPGGGIFRLEPDGRWTEVGRLPGVEAIGGLVTFRGRLHAASLYRPAGFFRMESGGQWTTLPVPDGKRVVSLAVHDRALYAGSYDGGRVYRYDGQAWSDLGLVGENTQTYGFATLEGRLCVSTWPSGRVYRLAGSEPARWDELGRLGEEREVMGVMLHNGKLYGGTLPRACVFRHDGGQTWTRTSQLDMTPDVTYRRAWAMAEYRGRVFCSTLPSGHVFAMRAGACTTHDQPLAPGWRHVAAVRKGGTLHLYVDGAEVAASESFDAARFDLNAEAPLRIGTGPGGSFRGRISDVRLYGRALEPAEVAGLAK